MVVWINKAGEYYEFEELFLKNNIIAIKWAKIKENLSNIKNKEELKEVYIKAYPDENNNQISNQVGQIWKFLNEMKKGDIVLSPLKNKKILIAKIVGEYTFNNEIPRHRRKIEILGYISDDDYISLFGRQLRFFRGTIAKPKNGNKNDEYLNDSEVLKLINIKNL
jgi:predicted Mrr-cat superfamily restriction endonuclease